MRKNLNLRTVCAAIACVFSISAFADANTQNRFNVPAGDLAAALKALARQADVEVVYLPKQVKNIRTEGIQGTYSAQEAIGLLLKGTSLKVHTDASGAMVISPAGPAGADAAPADQMRVADASGKSSSRESDSAKDDPEREGNQVVVEGSRERPKPFSDRNVDLPRTIDDPQAYYIFDSKTIERSGAASIEEFLKNRLTMNTTPRLNNQRIEDNQEGNLSSIDLRGLGPDKTLVLVNGRRVAGVQNGTLSYQPDLNGIALGAIDRIEILPSSASGIYGGSAIGGVVNVVLKEDYRGLEVSAKYQNTWDTDAPSRTISLNSGMALEGGRTRIMFSAQWSDAQPLLFQDRRELFDRGLSLILAKNPAVLYTSTRPFSGSLPNITAASSSATSLTLDDGTVLPFRNTYVPAGTAPDTPIGTLYAGLAANAGQWDLNLPASTQSRTGLLRPLGTTPKTRSLQATLRRGMGPAIEVFAEYSYQRNQTASIYNPFSGFISIEADSPINPFMDRVRVSYTSTHTVPITTDSQAHGFTAGVQFRLPAGWTAQLDGSRSISQFDYVFYIDDSFGFDADRIDGLINPFVDTTAHPMDLGKYLTRLAADNSSTLDDFTLRGSGPLWALPWGRPSMAFGLERRIGRIPENSYDQHYPITTGFDSHVVYFARKQVTDSGYLESTVPLAPAHRWPLLHALDLQLSGRAERYAVDTGTPYASYQPPSPLVTYGAPTLNGQPFSDRASYTSRDFTMGLKYQPAPGLTLRASRATAFLPPSPAQLLRNPLPDEDYGFPRTVQNRQTGTTDEIQTLSGGNPDLKPQNSISFNAGLIWESQWQALRGLRVNAEYYRIEQFDAISALPAQAIVDNEEQYPGRVSRDSSGLITQVDISAVNLFRRETQGYDLSLDYEWKTRMGAFSLHAAESVILHLRNQYATTLPEYESVGFPSEGGAARRKSNATLTWARRQWTAGWSARYFGRYKQYGAAGGPSSVQYYGGGVANTTYIDITGDTTPSQIYHDVFVEYVFGADGGKTGVRQGWAELFSGLSLQAGMHNVFNRLPPIDLYYAGYTSPYGDSRLRQYWLNIRKQL